MRKRFTIITIVAFLASSLFAQNHTTVYGNLGVENVNISVVNTQYGTSTDKKGHYELLIYHNGKETALHFSCIGYHDTIVMLKPKQLQHDSLNLSFTMQKMDYEIQEVSITASSDFYRSGTARNIADIAFIDGKILLLENMSKKSSLIVLDTFGIKESRKKLDNFYEQIYIDAFNDIILVGQDSCLQVWENADKEILPVSTFSREYYREKMLRILCEFNGAYIIKNEVHDRGVYYLKHNHGKTQSFSYILKDDPDKKPRPLCHFLDTVGYQACQSQWARIQAEYHQYTQEKECVDVIYDGVWDGYMVALAETSKLTALIQAYCHFEAKNYHIAMLKFDDYIQFIDLDMLNIIEIDRNFNTSQRRKLKVQSGEKHFKNQFFTDEATGKTYGLFVKDGINYLGLYNPEKRTVSMGGKASKSTYPRVFKIYGGYAYSVYFNSGMGYGTISRVRIE